MSHSYSDAEAIDAPHPASPAFQQVADARMTRRQVLKGAAILPLLALPGCATVLRAHDDGAISFTPISVSTDDIVRVPAGYTAEVLYRWGDPIGSAAGMPSFKPDAGNDAAEQALQACLHYDGIHFFPLPRGMQRSHHGLLAVNHEYTDDGLLHADGQQNWSSEKMLKAQHAHGVSIVEVEIRNGR